MPDSIRFGNNTTEPILPELGHNRVCRVPTRNNHLGLGINCQEFPGGLLAAHAARNGQIHDNGSKRLPQFLSLPVEFDGFSTLSGELHLVSAPGEHAAGDISHDLLIVHNQDPAFACERLLRLRLLYRDFLFGSGKIDVEGRSRPQFGLDTNMAVMPPNDGIGGRKPQAAPFLLGSEIGLEHPLEVFL